MKLFSADKSSVHLSLSVGMPSYCNGLMNLLGMNFLISYIQCPISVGGHITKEGSKAESAALLFCIYLSLSLFYN